MAEDPTPKPSEGDTTRQRVSETERIAELRARLYSRGPQRPTGFTRHDLGTEAPVKNGQGTATPVPQETQAAPLSVSQTDSMPRTSKRRSFRSNLIIVGVLFLIGALGASSFFLFLGNNTISGNNIEINVTGPSTVGGGERMDLQIAVANQNTLPIESATLIIDYPRGAQSATETGKELFTDRLQLNSIEPNEVVNVPVRLFVFGEQNDEKTITVSVEYRVKGSNATFYKEAAPFNFKIDSSPVLINVDGIKSSASGQETDLEVVIQSNSAEEIKDLLLKVSYPPGFDFTKSDPDTAAGQDTWRLKTLKPGEEQKIVLTGVIVGNEGDENQFDFMVGVANERDAYNIVSPLATAEHVITVEPPFLEVNVSVNGNSDEIIVVDPSATPRVIIEYTNALDTTVYDGVIRVELGGNALSEIDVRPEDGHYDSTSNTITWDSIDVKGLREIIPGAKQFVSFSIDPREDIEATPEIKLLVTIQGNRVGEDRVAEQVVGTIERTIKIASSAKLSSKALYSEGPFTNSGPVPPIAEMTTQYSILLSVRNGTNPVTGAEVSAVMPQYVTWLDMTSDDEAIQYNSSNRTVKWDVGELTANQYKEVWVQVAFKPSLSQVNLTPTILESQRFRATDRFTGTVVRTEAPALTTYLENDPDRSIREGRVQKSD